MNRIKKVLNYTALLAVLFCALFALTYALGVMTHPQPLKKASFVWWPESESDFYAVNKWGIFLKEGFERHGYDFHLATVLNPNLYDQLTSSDIIVIAAPIKKNFAFPFNHLKEGAKVYYWVLESPVFMDPLVSSADTNRFEKKFTWQRDLVDNDKTFFVPLDTRVTTGTKIPKDISHKRILAMQIASPYKSGGSSKNKYSLRHSSTLWWLKNHPQEYEFYGKDWPFLLENLNDNLKPAFHAAYKGYAEDKIKALSEAFFALAFENTVHRDYVSEKIYDVMKAGTVPVYLGAPNVEEFVPKECFINYADFKNDEDLYAFLKAVTPQQYQSYLDCAQRFFDGEQAARLHPNAIAQKLINEIF